MMRWTLWPSGLPASKNPAISASETGTPKEAGCLATVANIYLHYVFDLWADRWRKCHARGQVIIVRSPMTSSWVLSTKVKLDALWQPMEKFALSFVIVASGKDTTN
jgi:hypothetical protein